MKKYIFSTGLLLILLLFPLLQSFAQWVRVEERLPSWASCFVSNNSIVFAGTDEGLFLSKNNGNSWTPVNTGMGSPKITSLIASGSNLFAASWGGIFLSTDNGTSWTLANDTLGGIFGLAVIGGSILAWNVMGVFLSPDYGKNWTTVFTGPPGINSVNDVVVLGLNIYVGTEGLGLYYSEDLGITWTVLKDWKDSYGTPLYDNDVSHFIVMGTDLFAVVDYTLFLSTDEGKSWKCNNQSCGFDYYTVCGTNLFGGSGFGGIMRSTDLGKTWESVYPFSIDMYVMSLGVSGYTLFAGTGGGIIRSVDDGTNWVLTNTMPDIAVNTLLDSRCNAGLIAGTNDILAVSNFQGRDWYATSCGTGVNALATSSDSSGSTILFAGTDRGIFSVKIGEEWISNIVTTGLTDSVVISLVSETGISGNVFAGTWGEGVLLSTDKGVTWTPANNGLPRAARVTAVTLKDTNLFAGTWSDGVFLSTDKGATWTSMNKGLTSPGIRSFALIDSTLFVGTSDGLFVTRNNGKSWNALNAWGAPENIQGLTISGKNLFAGSYGQGVFYSPDLGSSWVDISNGLVNTSISSLAVSDNYIYAGTNDWVWRRPLSEIVNTVSSSYAGVAKKFSMGQCFPNPFNSATTIFFTLPFKSFISLKVFDLLGREVATIVSQEMSAGNYSRQWNAANMSSGIYFYRLQAGSFIETKKLILLK